MNGLATRNRYSPYLLAFIGSLCIMILELVASRLVARHVGASLNVWTSVIGIMLGGICLGNVLGGRLADRSEPSRVIGPLYAMGAALTLSCLWLNPIGSYIPEEGVPNWLRTVLLVSIDFLIPGTVLGMIGPVVAKIAVEQARKAGSAIGDVYFLGAVGSIAGTFLAGFYLMRYLPTTTIVTAVAASLALIGSFLFKSWFEKAMGLLTAFVLGVASLAPIIDQIPFIPRFAASVPVLLNFFMALFHGLRYLLKLEIPGFVGSIVQNPIALAGHVLAMAFAVVGMVRLAQAKLPVEPDSESQMTGTLPPKPQLGDLAALAFLISLAFMAFEMAAGRLVSRHLGSSIYGWTSIIGVLLGGLSLGNLLGGKIADFVKSEKQASWLFLAASALLLSVILLESPPSWLVWNPIGYLFKKAEPEPIIPNSTSILSSAISMTTISFGKIEIPVTWGYRLMIVITMAFFLPSIALGTVSPVMAKLAIDRVKRTKRTGSAIGVVYAWGMVGSILGTFLTGFLLIDVLGTKGVIIVLATVLALAATVIGTTWHAVWAGIPLGLCIIAFGPGLLAMIPITKVQAIAENLRVRTDMWGVREPVGDPKTGKNDGFAWIDESNYYYIKVDNEIDADGKKRTLVLDNLIHGYFILGTDLRLVSWGEGSKVPTSGHSLALLGLDDAGVVHLRIFDPIGKRVVDTDQLKRPDPQAQGFSTLKEQLARLGPPHVLTGSEKRQLLGEVNLLFGQDLALDHPDRLDYDYEHIYAIVSDRVARSKAKKEDPKATQTSSVKTLFLGGGAYTFQRYMLNRYPGSEAEVAEIDPAVREANFQALGLPRDTPIVTHLGDARQFVERNQNKKQFDIIYGDAFNDFSVPWHLTTKEFNNKLAKMLTPDGVYMINIIDAYESDEYAKEKAERTHRYAEDAYEEAKYEYIAEARAEFEKKTSDKPWSDEDVKKAEADFEKKGVPKPRPLEEELAAEKAAALEYSGFLGAWVNTVRETFPNVYVFGTNNRPGGGQRETFVVVVSKTPIDINDLGGRPEDPRFYPNERVKELMGYELRLMSAVNDPNEIPKIGRNRYFVADVKGVLTFRIFDQGGTLIVDTNENRLTGQPRDPEILKEVEGLKKKLVPFWDSRELMNGDDRAEVFQRIIHLVGHTQPKIYTKQEMEEVAVRSKGIILTDDFAPVENLLAPVARTRGAGD